MARNQRAAVLHAGAPLGRRFEQVADLADHGETGADQGQRRSSRPASKASPHAALATAARHMPPTRPDQVLLGLMRGASLAPPATGRRNRRRCRSPRRRPRSTGSSRGPAPADGAARAAPATAAERIDDGQRRADRPAARQPDPFRRPSAAPRAPPPDRSRGSRTRSPPAAAGPGRRPTRSAAAARETARRRHGALSRRRRHSAARGGGTRRSPAPDAPCRSPATACRRTPARRRPLPEQEIADALLAAGADQQVGIGHAGGQQLALEAGLVDALGRQLAGRDLAREAAGRLQDLVARAVVDADVDVDAGVGARALSRRRRCRARCPAPAGRGRRSRAAARRCVPSSSSSLRR